MSSRRLPDPGTAGERLLRAGQELLAERGVGTIVGGLSIASVAKAARTTRATFYAYWPTLDDYRIDLVASLIDGDTARTEAGALRATVELGSTSVGLVAVLREVAARDLRQHVASRTDRRRLGLAALADDPQIAALLRERYRQRDENQRGAFTAVLGRWAREPRPPLTVDDLLVVHDALLEGFVLRRAVDPDRATEELYATVNIALELLLSRAIVGEHDDLHDLLMRFDRVPDASTPTEPPRGTGRVPPSEIGDRVVRATGRLLYTESWADLSINELAAAAGLDPAEVVAACGSKPSIGALTASHLIRERVDRLAPVLDGLDPIDRMRRLVAECAAVYGTNPALAQATLQVLTGLAPSAQTGITSWWPSLAIADAVRDGQRAGRLRADLDAAGFAQAVARAVITDSVAHFPGQGVEVDSAALLLDAAQVIRTGEPH